MSGLVGGGAVGRPAGVGVGDEPGAETVRAELASSADIRFLVWVIESGADGGLLNDVVDSIGR